MMSGKQCLPILTLLALTTGAQAQSGFGGPPPGGFGGGFAPSPAMQARFQAWQAWRSTHKNVISLGRTLSSLSDMNTDPRTAYTKGQARAILAVIHHWETKPALTDPQARQVNALLTAPLTLAQIKKIATEDARHGGFRDGGRPDREIGGDNFRGGGRLGGGFGGDGRGRFDPASFPTPHDYNPLNPATNPMARERDRAQQRHAELMAALVAAK